MTVIALAATTLTVTEQIVMNISCTKFHAYQTKNVEHRAKFVTKLHQSWPRNMEQRGGNSLTPLSKVWLSLS
jgi:hypothetical protein